MASTGRFLVALFVFVLAMVGEPVSSSAPFWLRSVRVSNRRSSMAVDGRVAKTLPMVANKTTCDGDFYLMLDSSSSIGEQVFPRLTRYVKRVLSMFSPNQVPHKNLKAGVVRFSSSVDVLSRLVSVNDSSLTKALDDAKYVGGKPSLARAFRLMTAPSLWREPVQGEQFLNARVKSKLKSARSHDATEKRRRLLAVFTDGQFSDVEGELIRATLAVVRQTAAPVVFIGINGESSFINVQRLLSLTETPKNVYFLGPISTNQPSTTDELSAWNLASYLCYSIDRNH